MQEHADGQLSMFSIFRPEPVRRDPDQHGRGVIASGRVHTVLRLAHPKGDGTDRARIEIHPHEGRWMWATAFSLDGYGSSAYQVGPGWGKFAASMEDAIFWAVQELQFSVAQCSPSRQRDDIKRWLALYEPVERGEVSQGMLDTPLVGLGSEGPSQ